MSKYGKREDGTEKGEGYFGPLETPDGDVATEKSIGVSIGGKEHLIPSMVPTLSKDELDHLVNGGEPTRAIVDKAARHAIERMQAGRSVWAEEGERHPLPKSEDQELREGFTKASGR